MWQLALNCTSNLTHSHAWNPVQSIELYFVQTEFDIPNLDRPSTPTAPHGDAILDRSDLFFDQSNHLDLTTSVWSHLPIHVILWCQVAIFDRLNTNLDWSNLHRSELFKGFLSKFNTLLIKSLQAHCAQPIYITTSLHFHYIIYSSLNFILFSEFSYTVLQFLP